MNEIGKYIKKLRKIKNLTQQQLANTLNVSFQAVSKWETGETLPDTNILLDLCYELDTTVDTLLNGGIVNNRRRFIKVENIVNGFAHISYLKECFGENSIFYRGLVEGISNKMNFDFDKTLSSNIEVLYTEAVIQYLMNGYRIDMEEAKMWIKNEKYIKEIERHLTTEK